MGETNAYIVSELPAGVFCRLNNLGDIAGRAEESPSGEARATIWNRFNLRRRNLGKLEGGEYSSGSGITPTPTPTVQVTVQTTPIGLAFSVDGTTYSSTQTFSWVPGSSHTIATTSPQSGGTGVRYVWTNWTGGGGILHTVAPTTNTTYTANFRTQYYLTMAHGAGGTVTPASGWKNSGAAVSIRAMPASGYSFTNWSGSGIGSYSGTNNPVSITMGGPITETATFTHN